MDPNVQRFTGFAHLYDQYRPELPLIVGEVLSHECTTRAEIAEAKYAVSTGVRRWSKDQHLSRMRDSGLFRLTKEIFCHSVENGDARRLVGLAKSQGTVASLLKHGLSEDEIGVSDLRQAAERILVHQVSDWCSGVAIKMGRRQGATKEHIWIDT